MDTKVLVPRLEPAAKPYNSSYLINLPQRGAISNIQRLTQSHREKPNDYEVEVRVRAVGLNFRDLLNVMGLYPGDIGYPGSDFSGTVISVGSQVHNLKVGDDVFGLSNGCL